jgi:hypothetical protein
VFTNNIAEKMWTPCASPEKRRACWADAGQQTASLSSSIEEPLEVMCQIQTANARDTENGGKAKGDTSTFKPHVFPT